MNRQRDDIRVPKSRHFRTCMVIPASARKEMKDNAREVSQIIKIYPKSLLMLQILNALSFVIHTLSSQGEAPSSHTSSSPILRSNCPSSSHRNLPEASLFHLAASSGGFCVVWYLSIAPCFVLGANRNTKLPSHLSLLYPFSLHLSQGKPP